MRSRYESGAERQRQHCGGKSPRPVARASRSGQTPGHAREHFLEGAGRRTPVFPRMGAFPLIQLGSNSLGSDSIGCRIRPAALETVGAALLFKGRLLFLLNCQERARIGLRTGVVDLGDHVPLF